MTNTDNIRKEGKLNAMPLSERPEQDMIAIRDGQQFENEQIETV